MSWEALPGNARALGSHLKTDAGQVTPTAIYCLLRRCWIALWCMSDATSAPTHRRLGISHPLQDTHNNTTSIKSSVKTEEGLVRISGGYATLLDV